MQGVVNDVLPDTRFRVTLENGHELVAYTSGTSSTINTIGLPGP